MAGGVVMCEINISDSTKYIWFINPKGHPVRHLSVIKETICIEWT